MATNAGSPVVAVFTDHYDAQRAIDALQSAGFAGDQIDFMQRGFLTTQGNLSKDALVKMGIPEEDADRYQNEFELDRTIVVVRTPPDRSEEAKGMSRENGAADVNTF
jgi:hypothetical protein